MNVVCAIYYIVHIFWYVSTGDACIYAFALCLVCYVIYFGHVIYECGYLYFFKICRDFFRIFWAFNVAFCAYRPMPIRVAETDPSQCPPSRLPRPRLWTMIDTPQIVVMLAEINAKLDTLKTLDKRLTKVESTYDQTPPKNNRRNNTNIISNLDA